MRCSQLRGHEKVLELLMDGRANFNAQGGWHGNALQAASAGGYGKVVEMLDCKAARLARQECIDHCR